MPIYKIGFPIVAAGLLTACATFMGGDSLYQGNSTTFLDGSNVLRNDVTRQIVLIEHNTYQCDTVQSIYATIESISQDEKGLFHVKESWQVTACDKVHHYPIALHQSAGGGTDIVIAFHQ